jgi:predicted O-linked N-acetylglucosamine transferase (SPINDLY family)
MSLLIVELFELHDRERFEVIGVSTGPDDMSELRSRVANSFDRFYDVRLRSDDEIAMLINEMRVDVLVDLNGHTAHARFGILERRPARVQVSYLGFPGTSGAEFIDYVIADRIVLPFDQEDRAIAGYVFCHGSAETDFFAGAITKRGGPARRVRLLLLQ